MTPTATREQLRRYAEAIELWTRGFDTARIAVELKVHESIVERWVWSFREAARPAA